MRHARRHLLALSILLGAAVSLSAQTPAPGGAGGASPFVHSADDGMTFEAVEGFSQLAANDKAALPADAAPKMHRGLQLVPIALAVSVLAGLFLRVRQLRSLRPVLILASLVFFGFAMGGCPCPITILQSTVLATLGVGVEIHHVLWFLALLVLTYLLGRVYCGWVCHLGALQELLFRSPRLAPFRGERARRVMRAVQVTAFVALVVQLVLTRDVQFSRIDPFKVAFNLRSATTTGWVLLGLLLLSSLLVYRPFCRAFCPVGLVLGWVARLPGALGLRRDDGCRTCTLCTKSCAAQAIGDRAGAAAIRPDNCLACGACLDACPRGAISICRNAVNHA